jgi:flagellar biosynthesis/type III secretory pathway chaperone
MNENLSHLLQILDEETACYLEMQRILDAEESSMSLNKRAAFDRVQMEKEALLGRIQGQEKRRKKLVDALAATYRVNRDTVTVTQLAQAMSPPDDERLLSRATHLRACIKTVQLKNSQNRQLIRHYLDLITGGLRLLTHQIEDNAIYHKPGAGHPALGYARGRGRLFCGTV